MTKPSLLVLCSLLVLSACGSSGDDDSSTSSSSSNCDRVSGTDHYTYEGDDSQCKQFVKAYNADDVPLMLDSMGAGATGCDDDAGGAIVVNFQGCKLHIGGTCAGLELDSDCDVKKNGTASCAGTIRLPSGSKCVVGETIE